MHPKAQFEAFFLVLREQLGFLEPIHSLFHAGCNLALAVGSELFTCCRVDVVDLSDQSITRPREGSMEASRPAHPPAWPWCGGWGLWSHALGDWEGVTVRRGGHIAGSVGSHRGCPVRPDSQVT